MLFFLISSLRSKGEESREEKRIAGSAGFSTGWEVMGGVEERLAVVGGLLVMVGEEDSRIER